MRDLLDLRRQLQPASRYPQPNELTRGNAGNVSVRVVVDFLEHSGYRLRRVSAE